MTKEYAYPPEYWNRLFAKEHIGWDIGHVYEENGLFDFVRIFDKNFRLGKLSYIREKYLEHISNL